MRILVCPVCKGELKLKVATEVGDEVVEGALLCAKCSETYSINASIPNLLPPRMRPLREGR